MTDPVLELPRKLDPSFDGWKGDADNYDSHANTAGIAAFEGKILFVGVSGGEYEEKGRALASRCNLRGLCIEGRTIPQPLLDAAGEIHALEHLHLGNVGPRSLSPLVTLARLKSLYVEGIRGSQTLSVNAMSNLQSVSISGDADAVTSLLQDGNSNIRYLALGGTASANLRLADLDFLQLFPSIEYLLLLNVTVASRSLDPCLSLQNLQEVIVNFARSWDRSSIEALKDRGISFHSRMDEIRS